MLENIGYITQRKLITLQHTSYINVWSTFYYYRSLLFNDEFGGRLSDIGQTTCSEPVGWAIVIRLYEERIIKL